MLKPHRLLRDHPREYGENRSAPMTCVSPSGSSPRIRGKYVSQLVQGVNCRIIPANTGKIAGGVHSPTGRWDHPRENPAWGQYSCESAGSSPRIRGKYFIGQPRFGHARIIPANTGKMLQPFYELDGVVGSSPRIQGKFPCKLDHRDKARIIPANTGKIGRVCHWFFRHWDHPREYGENLGQIMR